VISVNSNLTDSVTFNWETPGTKTIAVTVENGLGTVVNSLDIDIWYPVYLPVVRNE
jgi:hypothetical protein